MDTLLKGLKKIEYKNGIKSKRIILYNGTFKRTKNSI
jgi:hypothetical protein